MLLLALDTATDQGGLALLQDGRLLAEYSLGSAGGYLQHLLPGLAALLKAGGRQPEEIGAIAVSQGPGNFTGLRIGLATAQGLALALGCPVVPVPTLEALAASFPGEPDPVAVLVDAKRGEVYLGRFDCRGDFPVPVGEPERLAAQDLPARLSPPLLLTGPGLTVYEDVLGPRLSTHIRVAPRSLRLSRAAQVGRLGLHRLARGLTVAPPLLTPLYLRPAL